MAEWNKWPNGTNGEGDRLLNTHSGRDDEIAAMLPLCPGCPYYCYVENFSASLYATMLVDSDRPAAPPLAHQSA